MRKLFFAVLLTLGLASLPFTLAAQHGAMVPSVAPPVMHAMPMHVAPATGLHAAPVRPGYRPYSQVRSGVRPAGSSVKTASTVKPAGRSTTPAPKTAWHPFIPQSTLPTYPPQVPNAPALLPGNIFSGQSCYSPLLCFPVPGLGFDYAHFFAVHPGWGSQILTAGVVVPFGGYGGFYLPIPYYSAPYYSAPPQQEEQPAAETSGAAQPDNSRNQQVVSEQPAAPYYYSSSEPVYEYVFVKRDGTKIFAVAYSLTKDKLQYVTKEGLRRSLPLDALDFDATQKSNEERGNTIKLPTPPPSAMAMAS
jgi:hypothetical protein